MEAGRPGSPASSPPVPLSPCPPPLSSLRLLIPPLRLLTATVWRAAQRQSVRHYGMLEDFVSMVTEAVPLLLTRRQTCLLLLALRTKVTLSDPGVHVLPAHLDKIRSISTATADSDVDECCSALLALSAAVSQRPDEARRLLQDVFDRDFDSALLSLLSDLLSSIELLFPVPDFKQAASWLDAAPAGVDDCLQDTEQLRQLLTNHSCSLERVPPTVGGDSEKTLLSAWSHPLITRPTNPDPPDPSDVQSEPALAVGRPVQLDTELVKVEMVVTTEVEAVICRTEPQASNEVAAVGGDKRPPEDSPVRGADRSEDTAGQSDRSASEGAASALHSISHNSQRVAHRCPRCGKCFIYRSQVIRHLRTNRSCGPQAAGAVQPPAGRPAASADEEPRPPEALADPRPIRAHSCFQCSAAFKSKAELLSHQRTHRARPVYRCAECDKQFRHLSSLTNHKQTHLDKAGFTCRRCNEAFASAEERDAHRARHRPPDLSCSVCSQAFGSQTQLLRHLQTHSAEGAAPGYNCRFCDQSFSGVTQLRIHQRSHTPRSHQCDQCSKSYGSVTGLSSHRASHSADSRFLCPQCGKRFKTRDGLEGHLRTHSGERPHRCPYCPKAFTALAGLNVHVRRHTGERPYVCAVCGKGWPSGGDLQKHMRTHTGERPYVCLDCGKAFSISCHLTEHRRIHTGEKPFSCPECGKCLRRKFDLKKHMLSHDNVRPHACTVCPKSYTRKTHLNRHLLTHRTAHGETAHGETAAAPEAAGAEEDEA